MAHIIIGTAGHIDHGKSALVKALTGTDPDRLAEEQERGMTIDLGFAFLTDNIAFIDVPGHEKFIKNMVAGVSTVNAAMLVIAADDGVMPQTREHLDILSLLQVEQGLIAVTKIDLVDAEWLEMVIEDIRDLVKGTFLKQAPIFRVSSVTGEGVDKLRQAILEMAGRIRARQDRGVFWMPIDRSFTIKGFGTVITGSVLSGTVTPGDTLEILPQKRTVKVRGIQKHGKPATEATLGDRAALNLTNIAKDEIHRGDVIATANYFTPSTLFDGKFRLLASAKKAMKNRTRVRVHLGTSEIMARVKILGQEKIEPGESAFVQLILEEEAVAMRHDPFVVRQYSPPITIGGGTILDTNPEPHRRFDENALKHLQSIETQNPEEIISAALLSRPYTEIDVQELAQKTGIDLKQLADALAEMEQKDIVMRLGSAKSPKYFHVVNYDKLKNKILSILKDFHTREPLRPGMSKAELKAQVTANISNNLFEKALNDLKENEQIEEQPQWVKLQSHRIKLSPEDEKLARSILDLLSAAQFSTPSDKEMADQLQQPMADIQRVLGALQGLGDILRMEGNIYFPAQSIEEAKKRLMDFARSKEEISVSEFRELLGTSRKYAMAILGHFDQIGLTERVGDVRVINKKIAALRS